MIVTKNICKILIIVWVVLLKCPPQVNSSCYFQDNNNRLAILYENDTLGILRTNSVPHGATIFLICNNDQSSVVCENGQFNPLISSLPYCQFSRQVELRLENDKKLCPFNLYRVGFTLECQSGNFFFETYKVCFDFEHKRAVFTINQAYPFVIGRQFGMQFDPDEIFTMNIFARYNKGSIYSKFVQTLGENQTYMTRNEQINRIDRGHLTPVGDYMSIKLQETTFKMINVIPQFHSINNGNWRRMEEWARNTINTPAKVCSGAFHWPLQLADTQGTLKEMYLGDNIIPIPLWTYKIGLNRHGQRTVFLQNNNIHGQIWPPKIPEGICVSMACPSGVGLIQDRGEGYTICCEPNHFINSVVPNLKGYC